MSQYAFIGNDASRDIRSLRQRINQLLRGAGGVYQLTDRGLCVRTDEPLFAAEVVEPAIAALASADMAAVRSDFNSARAALAASTPEGNERAMIKASAAIEGTLAVLMERLGLPTSKDGVDARVKVLVSAGHLHQHLEPLVTAASRIRNKEAGHSGHTAPVAASDASARAAVYASSVAIAYLMAPR